MPAGPPDFSPYGPVAFYSDKGSIEEFRELFKEANRLGFKIIVDFVGAHTGDLNGNRPLSDEEYLKMLLEIDGSTKERFVSVWERRLDHLNPATLTSLLWLMRFWVDLGAHGFRCDIAGTVPLYFWVQARQILSKLYPETELAWVAEWKEAPIAKAFDAIYAEDFYELLVKSSPSFLSILSEIDRVLSAIPGKLLLIFLDNHDKNWFWGTPVKLLGTVDGRYNPDKLKAHFLALYMALLLHKERVCIMEYTGNREAYREGIPFLKRPGPLNLSEKDLSDAEFANWHDTILGLVAEVVSKNGKVTPLKTNNPYIGEVVVEVDGKRILLKTNLTQGEWKAEIEEIGAAAPVLFETDSGQMLTTDVARVLNNLDIPGADGNRLMQRAGAIEQVRQSLEQAKALDETEGKLSLDEKIQLVSERHETSYEMMRERYGLDTLTYGITNSTTAKYIIKWLCDHGYLDSSKRFCDPCMGNGLLVHLAHVIAGADSTGYEIDPRIYQEAVKISHELSELGVVNPEHIHLIQADSSSESLKPYDVFYILPPWKDRVPDPYAGFVYNRTYESRGSHDSDRWYLSSKQLLCVSSS
jgi:hypothetical protein